MKQTEQQPRWFINATAMVGALLFAASAQAETLLSDFDNNFYFDAMYASWADQEPLLGGAVDWTITATNYGSAFTLFYEPDGFTPRIVDASADQFVEFTVDISVGAGDFAGPLLTLEDGDGTRFSYRTYGLTSGHFTLTYPLSVPSTIVATGSTAGLALTNLVGFTVECDPGLGVTKVYTLTLVNLRTIPAPPPACVTLLSDFNNAGVNGGYGSWIPTPPVAPDDFTVTATGFGGGYTSLGTHPDATGETTVELRVAVTNTADETGVTVVLQDADNTQQTWSWYGLTNGSYVLTQPLSAGNPVASWPGSIPGLQLTNLSWFHIQADPGSFTNNPYTVIFQNLELNGFNPEIQDFSFNPGAHEFDLIWDSRPGRRYNVAYVSDLNSSFSVVASNLLSSGTSMTNTVSVPAGQRGFLQVFEECQ